TSILNLGKQEGDDSRRSDPGFKTPVVIFGNASTRLNFGRVRKHRRGPIEAIKHALAKKAIVLEVSEFCSSKLCGWCGYQLQHPKARAATNSGAPKRRKRRRRRKI